MTIKFDTEFNAWVATFCNPTDGSAPWVPYDTTLGSTCEEAANKIWIAAETADPTASAARISVTVSDKVLADGQARQDAARSSGAVTSPVVAKPASGLCDSLFTDPIDNYTCVEIMKEADPSIRGAKLKALRDGTVASTAASVPLRPAATRSAAPSAVEETPAAPKEDSALVQSEKLLAKKPIYGLKLRTDYTQLRSEQFSAVPENACGIAGDFSIMNRGRFDNGGVSVRYGLDILLGGKLQIGVDWDVISRMLTFMLEPGIGASWGTGSGQVGFLVGPEFGLITAAPDQFYFTGNKLLPTSFNIGAFGKIFYLDKSGVFVGGSVHVGGSFNGQWEDRLPLVVSGAIEGGYYFGITKTDAEARAEAEAEAAEDTAASVIDETAAASLEDDLAAARSGKITK